MLKEGTKAPEFTLPDQNAQPVSLSDFLGKSVILYFYPRDNTPGCTRQARAFAERYDEFAARDAVVIGVSRDSPASHLRFAEKNGLPFILLSDPELAVIAPYGAWQEKKDRGRVSMGIVRSSYLIGRDGIIRRAMTRVKPDQNAAEMLALLDGED
ncbi:MAG: peroxiredoxin [Oscillospiraceae bacterium]|nr:MAG: peroxiredoxin [Oscillospiraceae bacterium]